MEGLTTVEIKVLAYNVWGMPRQLGGQQKSLRMPKLAKMLREGCQRKDYDIVLLSELWMKHDHEIIKQEMTEGGLYMTEWGQFNCFASPGGSSGLAIVSRMPLSEIDPLFFKTHGHLIATDGEWAARKGACRVRLNLHGLKIDAIVTHLIGDTFDSGGEDVNEKKRQKQAKELMDFANSRSPSTKADLVILGGDLNLQPSHASYQIIMSQEHGFKDTNILKEDQHEQIVTFGHPENTYTGKKADPMTLDYIFVKSTSEKAEIIAMEQAVKETEFQFKDMEMETKSMSDHSPVLAKITIRVNNNES